MRPLTNRFFALLAIAMCIVFAPHAAFAVDPDEVLDDRALETRARAISRELRCVVCQSESIDDSSAPLAKDLRLLVRERLLAGDDDKAVVDYVVARYGEYVLLKPRVTLSTLLLWGAPVLFLGLGVGGAILALRRPRPPSERAMADAERAAAPEFSQDDRARLQRLLSR